MFSINKHKFFLTQILKDIYTDASLAISLGFKGGTALMFFYDLPRFSVDMDFNLLDASQEKIVYDKVRSILLKYGNIFDEALKFNGQIIVLDYSIGERKLKVEISNRQFDNHYEVKNFLGINMNVMVEADMFAHKLCALLDRGSVTNRDIFDCYFFMQRLTPINYKIVETRMGMPAPEYLQKCIDHLETMKDRGLLNGLGEMMDDKTKKFVLTKLRLETITLLKTYKEFPISM